MINIWDEYAVFDKMNEKIEKEREREKNKARDSARHKAWLTTEVGYFPSIADINAYVKEDPEHMIPFLLWLEDRAGEDTRREKREEIAYARELINQYTEG